MALRFGASAAKRALAAPLAGECASSSPNVRWVARGFFSCVLAFILLCVWCLSGVRGAEGGGGCVHWMRREPARGKLVRGHEGSPGVVL